MNNELHWLSIEIIVTKNNGEEISICQGVKKLLCPRKGEYIWMDYNWEGKKKFGTRAFIVEDVAHHIADNLKVTYDNVVIYCNPLKKNPSKKMKTNNL